MKVVNYSEAARMAGVTRQRINGMKNDNIKKKGLYPFFVFDPDTGRKGVDIDNKKWIDFKNRENYQRVNKKEIQEKPKGKSIVNEQSNNINTETIIDAVVLAVKEMFNLSGKELDKLLRLIDKKHEGLNR